MRVPDLFSRACTAGALSIALSFSFAPALASDAAMPDADYSIVHGFVLTEGAGPLAPVVQAADGNLYGTTLYGSSEGNGVVYRVSPSGGKFKILHKFQDPDGLKPATGLTEGRNGELFGLTSTGGRYGGGTAFRITTRGKFKVLHAFGGPSGDGSGATYGRLAPGPGGNFLGVQSAGGAHGFGTVFKMTPQGKVTVLHAFKGGPTDGARPLGGLVPAPDGNFYGTTQAGGANDADNAGGGTLYRITPEGDYKVLVDFAGKPRKGVGRGPQSAPVPGRDGRLYGVTPLGGSADFGTVYRVETDGTNFETLHEFRGGVLAQPPNGDGATPLAQLLLADNGSLYGTSYDGGPNAGPVGTGGGTIFEIARDGTYTRVRDLGESSTDAALPVGALIQADNGRLYGTTWAGGPESLHGTVYRFVP